MGCRLMNVKTNPGLVMILDKTIIFTGFIKCFTAVKTHIEMLLKILTETPLKSG